MLRWLFRDKNKGPSSGAFASYEYLGTNDDSSGEDSSLISKNPFRSTYSPTASAATYEDSDSARTFSSSHTSLLFEKKPNWWLKPSNCCISCFCCFKDKDKLRNTGIFARWKVAACISSFILLLLGILLCIFFVVIAPMIVQAIVDDSALAFDSIILSDPIYNSTAQSFRMKATAELSTTLPLLRLDGQIDRTDFSLFYQGSLLGRFVLPPTDITVGKRSQLTIDTVVTIADMDTFDRFGYAAIHDDKVTIHLSGKPDLKALSLTYKDVTMEKDSTVTAAGGLKNVEIISFDLSQSNKTNVNAAMIAKLYNPSALSIAPLGRLDFVVYYKNYSIASMLSEDLTLVQGENFIHMFGALEPANLRISDELISNYLAGEPNTVVAAAKPGSESSIPLWARILKGFSLVAELDGNTTNLIKDLHVNHLEIDPINNVMARLSQQLDIVVNNPLGDSPIDLRQALLHANLLYNIPEEDAARYENASGVIYYPASFYSGYSTTGQRALPRYLLLGRLLMAAPINITGGDQPIVSLNYTVNLELYDGGKNFGIFTEQFVQAYSLNITLNGTIDANVTTALGENILTNLLLNTTTTIKGLNNLPNVTILSFDLPRNSPLGGVEILLNATLFNPTVGSLYLGNVTFEVLYSEFPMGLASATGLSLYPGSIFASMVGNILPAPSALPAASMLFSNYIRGFDSVVGVRGYDIATDIVWLKEMVTHVNTTSVLKGWDSSPIAGVEILSLGIDFETNGPPLVNSTLIVDFVLPFDFPLEINRFAAVLLLSFQSTQFATVIVPFSPASSNQTAGQLYLSFSNLDLIVADNATFSLFINDLLLNPNSTISIEGLSDAVASTAMGNISLREIPFEEFVTVTGIDRFSNPPVEVVDADVTSGHPGYLELALVLKITNPSPTSLATGPLSVILMYTDNDTAVGNGTIDNLWLEPGINYVSASGYFVQREDNYDATYEFLSNFAQGNDMQIKIQGIPGSVKHSVLREAVGNLRSPAHIPVANRSLIAYAKLEFNLFDFFAGFMLVKLTVFNPYNVRFQLNTAVINVYNAGVKIGTLNSTDLNIVAGPKETVVTRSLRVKIEAFTLAEFFALFSVIKLDVNGTLEIVIGNGFESGVFYAQQQVPGSFLNGPTELFSFDDASSSASPSSSYEASQLLQPSPTLREAAYDISRGEAESK